MAEHLQPILALLKAVADESRLRILGILAASDRSVDELAAQLELKPPTVSHHLTKLKQQGLVTMRQDGNVHLYRLDTQALTRLSKEVLRLPTTVEAETTPGEDKWATKVLKDFLSGERLKEIPASHKKRAVVLHWLADKFDRDRRYRELEVNDVLKRHHPDAATLRRELVVAGLLNRESSIYWRPSAVPDRR